MARADILSVLYTKNISPLEFHFENLKGIPLLSMISMTDIKYIDDIAIDPRIKKPRDKLKYINQILNPRGFRKLAAGTNRICYKFLEEPSIVLKVATSRVAQKDNPNEYNNQMFLKPFVCKCFEVTPSGTIGEFERVEPITSKEEFISIAPDVFDMLYKHIDGRYILEDVGSDYFLNYGLRKSFGPVLLDYAYMYELDGKKLYCNKPDLTSHTGTCDGAIDYDAGFNNLICEKCGKRYFAIELKKDIENNNILVNNEQGEYNMRIRLSRGNQIIMEKDTNGFKVTDTIKPVADKVTENPIPEVDLNNIPNSETVLYNHTSNNEPISIPAPPIRNNSYIPNMDNPNPYDIKKEEQDLSTITKEEQPTYENSETVSLVEKILDNIENTEVQTVEDEIPECTVPVVEPEDVERDENDKGTFSIDIPKVDPLYSNNVEELSGKELIKELSEKEAEDVHFVNKPVDLMSEF